MLGRILTVGCPFTHVAAHIDNTTNTSHGPGPAYFINHVENAAFGINTDLLALENLFPKHPPAGALTNGYLLNSRPEDEKVVWTWVNSPVAALILWIHGAAGMGKSTLAQHIQQQLRSQGRLAAAIFLGAFRARPPDPETVIRLIAGELGRIHNEAISAILEAYRQCHGVPPDALAKRLVLDVVRSLHLPQALIVVLDAADEWPFHEAFMEVLSYLESSLIRFIVLGRLEPQGRAFRNLSIQMHPLAQVPSDVMQGYLNRRLDRVEWDSGIKPSSYDIRKLAEKADGLFIWAATACALLEDKLSPTSPRETLAAILDSRRSLGETDDLKALYRSAIILLFPRPEDQSCVKVFLGAVMVLQEPLPPAAFASLAGMREPVIKEVQSRLKALQIRQPSQSDPIRVPRIHPAGSLFHLSFIEFLEGHFSDANLTPVISTFDCHAGFARVGLQELIHLPSATLDLRLRELSPLHQYIVKYLALHLSKGAWRVTPASASDWEASHLCSTLRHVPITAFHQWGLLLLRTVEPGFVTPPSRNKRDATGLQKLFEQTHRIRTAAYNNGEQGLVVVDVARSLHTGGNLQPFRIPCLEIATRLFPNIEDAWVELGDAYLDLAGISTMNDALQEAIMAFRNARNAGVKSGITGRWKVLCSLARALLSSFERSGEWNMLSEALDLHREALKLHAPWHPGRSSALGNLALCLLRRYRATGFDGDLREATEIYREALRLRHDEDPGRSMNLNNLASCIIARYRMTGSHGDLHEATKLHREALALRPHGHPDRSMTLNNLAVCFDFQYSTTGSYDYLRNASELHREAITLRPHGHPHRWMSLGNLALCFNSRYEATGADEDLRQAIELHREALALLHPGHPERSMALNNLAVCFKCRYSATGSNDSLWEAIELHKEALALRPHGHRDRWMSLCNLALCLESSPRSASNLWEVIQLRREMLPLCPPGHPFHSEALKSLRFAGVEAGSEEAAALPRLN